MRVPRSAAAVAATLRAAVARGAEQGRQELRAAGMEVEDRTRDVASVGDEEVEAIAPTGDAVGRTDSGHVRGMAPTAGGGGQEVETAPGFGPMARVEVEQGAIASTSHQPRPPEGPDAWGSGLDQPGVPDQLVWDAKAEKGLLQEYHQIGVSMQNALYNAFALHTNRALQVHQVSAFAFALSDFLFLFLYMFHLGPFSFWQDLRLQTG